MHYACIGMVFASSPPPPLQLLRERYYPRSDQVVALYHELCSSVREKRQLDPLDPAFPPPLLKPECQLVALLAHLCRTSSSMVSLSRPHSVV